METDPKEENQIAPFKGRPMTKQQLDLISKRLAAFIQDYIEENGIKPSTLNCVRWAFKDSDEELQSLKEHIESLQGQLAEAREVIGFYANKKNWCRGDAYDPSVFIGDDDEEWKGKSYLNGFKARAFIEKYPEGK